MSRPAPETPDALTREHVVETESAVRLPIEAPIRGRGKTVDFALRRLKANPLLQGSMVMAFVGYGGLIALTLARPSFFGTAAKVALMSLASWCFLFWWYPVLERTLVALGDDPRRQWIGKALEAVAITCVLLVHALMAVIIVYQARS